MGRDTGKDTDQDTLRFDGQVAVVTGAGRGLGRAHALLLASRGARVLVNDPGVAYDGSGETEHQVADQVVAEIKRAGGEALANHDSVEQGDAIIDAAMDAWGRVDIVVNNAGIVTPETWNDLTLESWQKTININLTGVFSVTKAAWPTMVNQTYGRIVVTASPAIYGAGVAAYAASKAGVMGLANSLQFEAMKLKMDIACNIIIPQANTRMVQDLNSSISATRVARGKSELKQAPDAVTSIMGPEKVSAIVAWLSHQSCDARAQVFEAGAGYFAQLHWARSAPLLVTEKEGAKVPLPEHIRDGWDQLNNFADGDMPKSGDGGMGSPGGFDQVFRHLR